MLSDFHGKGGYGDEVGKLRWWWRQRTTVKRKEEELEVAEPNEEDGCGCAEMKGMEIQREDGEQVEDGDEGDEPLQAPWYGRCYVITIT